MCGFSRYNSGSSKNSINACAEGLAPVIKRNLYSAVNKCSQLGFRDAHLFTDLVAIIEQDQSRDATYPVFR